VSRFATPVTLANPRLAYGFSLPFVVGVATDAEFVGGVSIDLRVGGLPLDAEPY